MAALLLSSVTSAKVAPAPTRPAPALGGGGLARPTSPSIGLPLRFVVTGVVALISGMGMLVARPELLTTYHYNQYAVAVTHWLVLGFLLSVVMGALYQMVPVVLETPLYSERLGRWQFLCQVIGVVGMVAMFWRWDLKQVGHFGSVLALGVGLFVYNILRTVWRAPRRDFIAAGIVSSLAWLSVTVTVGLAVAAAKCTYGEGPDTALRTLAAPMIVALERVALALGRLDPLAVMHTHAHLGVVGCFLMLIVAVSYKLVPMFALSDLQSQRRAAWSIGLLNAGLLGLMFALPAKHFTKLLFAAVILAGLSLYGLELRAILRARVRRSLDWGLRHYLTAMGFLGIAAVLGVILGLPGLPATPFTTQLEGVYGFLGLFGVVALTILGFLYKIVPFLIWYRAYSGHVGRWQVPSLGDLYSERLQVVSYAALVAGLVITSVGSAFSQVWGVRTGTGLLAVGLVIFAVNMALILSHLFRPRLQPLPGRASPTPTPSTKEKP